jgi:hypothetical protein
LGQFVPLLDGAIVGSSLCLGSQSALRGGAEGSGAELGQPCLCGGLRDVAALEAALASVVSEVPEEGATLGGASVATGASATGVGCEAEGAGEEPSSPTPAGAAGRSCNELK